ncbi:MAG: HsdR family type I site-specific deoxyribonuclease [Hydrotalea flava]|uniref:type I restriction endonuclease subunit R n=1 Tax=Hydrotalea TaxID=1004300 RepID=UPI0009438085|nr:MULTISPECIES: HsdR family type I site-specific deoxyribonuclease [Hydrotalea]NIM34984.1 HsdR family type I site-specific deoxyribonuclease [Hydrotalea flava]NIM37810.1 HsdR family type I site-specific deoxyribonuclease [Hydrotalea flava]NIN02979.1 HsdR family type I site-specific deoxyribonuclease [Hydrotalea flava]NIN14664.1 HsdR family type I site-specific deoxyribonuclease [Hydrotalea flava]NIO93736.1 HsdR family type I site-specific deoxyribonuclease [Hydrotalea flava]
MDTPSFKEDHISQIPAMQMLVNLGYTYLSPAEAERLRGGKTTNVLLEDVLRRQLKEINSIRVSATKTSIFTDENIERGILALKNLPMNEGYIAASEKVYNLLTLGQALEQSVDGDKKSFTLQYIDWKNISNNVFHVTEEFSVMRSTSKEHYRPDLVLFVNGIPLCIIECKRPDMKEPLKQAISQHLRNQQEDGIRSLYVYSQFTLSIATQEAAYATNATPEKFWAKWQEKFSNDEEERNYKNKLHELKNKPLPVSIKEQLFSDRFKYVRQYFDAIEQEEILPTEQDNYLYGLCRPERLMDIVFNYVLFDNGEKKVARYQQFFAIKKSMQRIRNVENGKRKGGVIWHTQGSGKSLTMVMLAQAIAMEPSIRNPKIVLVTDRTDLDNQITSTFRKCGKFVENATTGQRLVELLESKSDAVVTTIINKFVAAVKKINQPLESHDIFVLIDEGHRTQHGTFNVDMQKTLPNACFIAMTGTPLFKKDKSTAAKFGGVIDAYTVDQAVKDKAVVPLLYEGRLALQDVNASPIDTFFGMVSEPLTEYQKADIKKKFARYDHLNSAEQKMRMIAWDISYHFRDNWQGKTPFKGQLVCDKKVNAIKYKEYLDEIGIVSSEVLISSIDEREGEESAYEKSTEKENQFWKKMMDEHGNSKSYEKNIISRFKNQKDPEIIIVVDKLLTGFDEPKNTVLYLTRNLQGHKLLQAIARVNRIYPDKEFGYIIDYYGVIENLDDALQMYSSFEDFDEEDLAGTLTNISEEIKKLPQKHSDLWDIFKTIANKRDAEAYQQLLKDEAIRVLFYDKLATFAKSLKLALSSIQFHKEVEEKVINRYKEDLAMFLKLRLAVVERYSDEIDYKQYEGQIQKLIDTHITTEKIETITELINIFDKDKFQQEVENTTGKAAKADKIASRTAKHITEKMDEDPAFYKKFSQMLKETIADYEAKRISEAQYLSRVQDIMNSVLAHTDNDIPEQLKNRDVAKAFYGLTVEALSDKIQDNIVRKEVATQTALQIDDLIQDSVLDSGKPIIDWQFKTNITGKLLIEIGDYLIDEVRDKYNVDLSFKDMDKIAEDCIEVAKIRYK